MFGLSKKGKIRRQQVRDQKAKTAASMRGRGGFRLLSLPVAVVVLWVLLSVALTIWGAPRLGYVIGQRIAHPVYARVQFQVPDPEKSQADRDAARAATASYYRPNAASLTFDRIRRDLDWIYQSAADAEGFEDYQKAMTDRGWPAEERAYRRLRSLVDMPNDAGSGQFKEMIESLPLESEYVVKDFRKEPRTPRSTTDYIVLITDDAAGQESPQRIETKNLVHQGNIRALTGSADGASRRLPYQLEATAKQVILAAFREHPTIVFDQERTLAAMGQAEESTPAAMKTFENGKPFLEPGKTIGSVDFKLLEAEHDAYLEFLDSGATEASLLRQEYWMRRAGLAVLVAMLGVGLVIYTVIHQPRVFENHVRALALFGLLFLMLMAARMLNRQWPHIPELVIAPALIAASILSIVYPRRFAIGIMCLACVVMATMLQGSLPLLLTLVTGVAVAAYQLEEIRSRTKVITAGLLTAVVTILASGAGAVAQGHSYELLIQKTSWAGGCAMLAAFIVSGILPFIERAFRVATSLTLLEWRDPTKSLLQLLAREAPGTYNHSLVLGTLAEAACERIGANGLLAQVGALYHDIGKIHKAHYFVENQEGGISRHKNLAPNMSLLIILGHVKDGVEMAREYKLPRILHQFVAEHHGTTVVRYFHHVASEMQPKIASGKHDREVPEAEFRYGGPKPRTRESAVVMLCDGVEGAVRALNEPAVGRIESVVHHIILDRLNDGQLADCDMTMREIRLIEESLVKTLCSIYHGRVAYPKALRPREVAPVQAKISG